MCFDSISETIFLFGGWDGHQDLSDLWSYHVPTNKWKLISYDVESEVCHLRMLLYLQLMNTTKTIYFFLSFINFFVLWSFVQMHTSSDEFIFTKKSHEPLFFLETKVVLNWQFWTLFFLSRNRQILKIRIIKKYYFIINFYLINFILFQGGPSPRSCHKICCNPQRREIFVLGRYLGGLYRTAYNLKVSKALI